MEGLAILLFGGLERCINKVANPGTAFSGLSHSSPLTFCVVDVTFSTTITTTISASMTFYGSSSTATTSNNAAACGFFAASLFSFVAGFFPSSIGLRLAILFSTHAKIIPKRKPHHPTKDDAVFCVSDRNGNRTLTSRFIPLLED